MEVQARNHGLKRNQTFQSNTVTAPPGKRLIRSSADAARPTAMDGNSGMTVFVVSESSMIDLCMVKNENDATLPQEVSKRDLRNVLELSPVAIKEEPQDPDLDSLVEVFEECSNEESDTELRTNYNSTDKSSSSGQNLHNGLTQSPILRYQMVVPKPVMPSPLIGLKHSHHEIKLGNLSFNKKLG